MQSIRESILNKAQLAPVRMHSETLDMDVFIRRLPANQIENWQLKRLDKKTGKPDYNRVGGYREDLVQKCLCEEDGSLSFPDPAELGSTLDNAAMEELFGFCESVNSIKKEAVKEAEGNS